MYDFKDSAKNLFQIKNFYSDNSVFRLHKCTVLVLLVFSLIISFKQYAEKPMTCVSNSIPVTDVMNTFCWISSTYTIPKYEPYKQTYAKALTSPRSATSKDMDETKHYAYYQWVNVALFIQALLFYLPRYIWKCWEGGRIWTLTSDLKIDVTDPIRRQQQRLKLCHYFLSNRNNHNIYFLKFVICELLSFTNALGQMFFMDFFFNGYFTTYGLHMLNIMARNDQTRMDFMSVIFPKVTKCSLDTFRTPKPLDNSDVLCVVPVNSTNEKVYTFLWFWFVILAVLTGIVVFYRLIIMSSSRLRYLQTSSKFKLIPKQDVRTLIEHFQIGEWFMFCQISKHVDNIFLREMAMELSDSISGAERNYPV